MGLASLFAQEWALPSYTGGNASCWVANSPCPRPLQVAYVLGQMQDAHAVATLK